MKCLDNLTNRYLHFLRYFKNLVYVYLMSSSICKYLIFLLILLSTLPLSPLNLFKTSYFYLKKYTHANLERTFVKVTI